MIRNLLNEASNNSFYGKSPSNVNCTGKSLEVGNPKRKKSLRQKFLQSSYGSEAFWF